MVNQNDIHPEEIEEIIVTINRKQSRTVAEKGLAWRLALAWCVCGKKSQVTEAPQEIVGRNKLVLKPRNSIEQKYYTMDDEW